MSRNFFLGLLDLVSWKGKSHMMFIYILSKPHLNMDDDSFYINLKGHYYSVSAIG